jgi:hypothetical protein
MSKLELLIRLAESNPSALECLEQLINESQDLVSGANLEKRKQILNFIEANEITGTYLYVLYSDIADKNLDLMHYIIDNAPINKVKAASSVQDYSGRKILKNWIDGYKISNR